MNCSYEVGYGNRLRIESSIIIRLRRRGWILHTWVITSHLQTCLPRPEYNIMPDQLDHQIYLTPTWQCKNCRVYLIWTVEERNGTGHTGKILILTFLWRHSRCVGSELLFVFKRIAFISVLWKNPRYPGSRFPELHYRYLLLVPIYWLIKSHSCTTLRNDNELIIATRKKR